MPTRCALYARVSTTDQHCENQLAELRAYCASRGWNSAATPGMGPPTIRAPDKPPGSGGRQFGLLEVH